MTKQKVGLNCAKLLLSEGNLIFRFSSVVFSVLLSGSIFTACVPPTDLLLPVPTSSPSPEAAASTTYAGFAGITSAQTLSSTKVKLSWNPTADPSVIAYSIYDSTNPFLIKQVASVRTSLSSPVTFVSVANLIPQSLYLFRVHAVDSDGVEDTNTVDVSAIPYAGISSTFTNLSATSTQLNFSDGSNADFINIYCSTTTPAKYQLMNSLTTLTATPRTSVTLEELSAGTRYTCRAALQIGNYPDDNNTATVSFTPVGTATQMVFSTPPGGTNAGTAFFPQPVVKILDTNGTLVSAGPDSTAFITLTSTTGNLGPSASVGMNAVGGIADFTGKAITVTSAGTNTLTATKTVSASQATIAPIVSPSFNVSAGAASAAKSSLTLTPSGDSVVADGLNGSYTVKIELKD